jgi:molybdopterin-guanine dinucleotide biosynthesis adapter protein
VKIIGLAGWSGAGKTTVLVRLIPELARRGLKVSTLKHAHHAFDIDHPAKDSFAHRSAGATEVLVASGRRWALIHELRDEAEPSLAELLLHLSPVDLVIVEGFKAYAHPKVEIHRVTNGKPFLFPEVPNITAVATDGPAPATKLPILHLDDIAAIADHVLRTAVERDTLVRELQALPIPERIRQPARSDTT